LIGKYSLAAIDQKIVGAYRDLRLAGNKQMKMDAVGDSTVRKEIFMLSKLMKFAQIECGILLPRGNPVDNVRKPSEGKGRERRLTKEEFTRLETEIKKSRNKLLYPAFQFAIETAARQNEILSLTWQHVNLDRKFALLKDTKNGETRTTIFSDVALEALESLGLKTEGEVWSITESQLRRQWEEARADIGADDLHFHDLRHEGTSRLFEKGLNVFEVQSITGHKTLSELRKYTHLTPSTIRAKLNKKP